MGRVAVIGEGVRVSGFALAGALVLPAETDVEVRSQWASLPDDVDVVILTDAAARQVGVPDRGPLRVVMPP